MNYIDYIEESGQWTCPATGKWKVICVGGGSSAYAVLSLTDVNITGAGKDTSFGTSFVAKGGVVNKKYGMQCYNSNGFFPYENKYPEFTDNYSAIQPGTMGGYGGSVVVCPKSGYMRIDSDMNIGGVEGYGYFYVGQSIDLGKYSYVNSSGYEYKNNNWNETMWLSNGVAGEVKINIMDLTAGTSIPVTIGAGGTIQCTPSIAWTFISASKTKYQSNNSGNTYTFTLNSDVSDSNGTKLSAKINRCAFTGRPGVVILQYLGA